MANERECNAMAIYSRNAGRAVFVFGCTTTVAPKEGRHKSRQYGNKARAPQSGYQVVVESQTFKSCKISRVQPKTTPTCHLPEIACVVDTRLDRLPQPHLVGNHSTPLFLQDKFHALLLERSKRFSYTFRHLTAPDTSTTKDERGNDVTHRMDDPHPTTHIRERRPRLLLSESLRLSMPSQTWQHFIAEMESRLIGSQFAATRLTHFGTRLRVPRLLCGATYTPTKKNTQQVWLTIFSQSFTEDASFLSPASFPAPSAPWSGPMANVAAASACRGTGTTCSSGDVP